MKKVFVCLMLAFSTVASAEDAVDLWKAKCKSCHGEDGAAKTKMGEKHKIPDISSMKWQGRHDDAKIQAAIADGVPETKMKAYKDKLSEAEIDSLVRYVRGLKK